MLSLDTFEKGLEVASTETIMVTSLDNFEEKGGAILEGLGENLEQVALIVVVDQDFQTLKGVDILRHLSAHILKTFSKTVVICVGDFVQKFDSTGLHALDRGHNILGTHSDVLDTGATVVIAEFLNLTFTDAFSGLVDGHFDVFIEVGHDDGAEGRELGVEHFVVDGPESVEVEHLLVPLGNGLHLAIGLVSDAVINKFELRHGAKLVHGLSQVMSSVSREEGSLVVDALNEGVDGVTVGLDGGGDNSAMFVLELLGLVDGDGSALDGLGVDACGIVNGEGDVLDAISVLFDVIAHLSVAGVQGGGEGVHDIAVADDVGANLALTGLESLEEARAHKVSLNGLGSR